MFKYFLIYVLPFLTLVVSGQKQSISENKLTKISGTILNYKPAKMPNTASVGLINYLQSVSSDYESSINNEGEFEISFLINRPQNLYVSAINIIDLIIFPGDEIHLTINADLRHNKKKFIKKTIINGDHSTINRQFLMYNASDIPGEYFMNNRENLEPIEFRRQLDSLMPLREKHIVDFIKKNEVEPQLKNWLTARRKFEYHHILYQYPYYYKMFNYKLPKIDSLSFYKNIKVVPKVEDKDLINTLASYTLPISYLTNIQPNIHFDQVTYSQNDLENIIKTLQTRGKENSLFSQLTLYHAFINNMNSNEISLFENNRGLLDIYIQNTVLRDQLKRKYVSTKKELAGINFGSYTEKNAKKFLENVKQENYGKVIYIDHWATWCLPCLFSFRDYDTFQEKFEDDITYIFVAHQSDYNRWKEIILNYGLKGDHYFIGENEEYFLRELDIQGFPTYMIIDKQGKTVKSGFDYSPEKEETKALIMKLINEQ